MKQFKMQQEQEKISEKKKDDLKMLKDYGVDPDVPVIIYEPDTIVQKGKTISKVLLGIVFFAILCGAIDRFEDANALLQTALREENRAYVQIDPAE